LNIFLKNSPIKTVVIITGPTAVGKTSVAIQLAKYFQTEIISADSRQCFKEMNIGVARPSDNELNEVKHHFIASHSVKQEVTAAIFEGYALDKVSELFQRHNIVIMVGGTGLYIKAFCEGLDLIPTVDPAIRQQIIQSYEKNGIEWLQDQLQKNDPLFAQTGEMQNPQRMMRALEVVESTGKSILSYRRGEKIKRDFNILKIGVEVPKEIMHTNINSRVNTMIENGQLEEVKQLLPYRKLNALQSVGYSEFFDYLDSKISFNEAIEKVKTSTRQYAKRQLTWFKNDKDINWFSPMQIKEIIESVEPRL
jgi:tRNA dimethylallyltransferase